MKLTIALHSDDCVGTTAGTTRCIRARVGQLCQFFALRGDALYWILGKLNEAASKPEDDCPECGADPDELHAEDCGLYADEDQDDDPFWGGVDRAWAEYKDGRIA